MKLATLNTQTRKLATRNVVSLSLSSCIQLDQWSLQGSSSLRVARGTSRKRTRERAANTRGALVTSFASSGHDVFHIIQMESSLAHLIISPYFRWKNKTFSHKIILSLLYATVSPAFCDNKFCCCCFFFQNIFSKLTKLLSGVSSSLTWLLLSEYS